MITSPRRTARRAVAGLAACAALGALPAAASALDGTIRIEGATQTLLPESAIAIEGGGATATVFDETGAPFDVGRDTAFWQLARATSGASLPFEFRGFSFGLQVTTIGPDTSAGSVGWQYKVNNASAQVGPDRTALADGDSVLWFHGGFSGARNLDVAPAADRLERGTSFAVTVTSYDADGAPSPAAGAEVTYGSARATADGNGRATFIARGEGIATVAATRAGDVRSPARPVCSYADDPTVCNLPPAPPQPAPDEPAASAFDDTVAPGSAIRRPQLRSRRGAVRALAGTAGPDRSDVARVDVALALRVGTQCRFRTAAGRLAAARPCGQPEWVRARLSGTHWVMPLGRSLPPGIWRVETRATDGAGNTETVRIPRVNIGAFRVLGDAISPRTRVVAPSRGMRARTVRGVRGLAGPRAADIVLTEVALARRARGGCRFLTARGSLSPVRPCTARTYLPARSRGVRWALPVTRPLPPGVWVAVARSRAANGLVGRPHGHAFAVIPGGAR